MELLKHIVIMVFVLIILSTIFVTIIVLLENRDPSKTLVWLLVLILFPVVGFIFYLFLGQNVKKHKIFKTKKAFDEIRKTNMFKYLTEMENLIEIQRDAIFSDMIFSKPEMRCKRRIIKLLLNTGKSPFTANNKVEILQNANKKFKYLLSDLKHAKDHIHMEYYIFKESQIGNKISDILIQKAKEGVKIRILYDDVGSYKHWFDKKFINRLIENGIELASFLPSYFPFLNRKLNYRNHRKIVIIDGKIAYTGGINIGDEYLGKNKKFGFWRDTHMKIEGESVYMLQMVFLLDWYFTTNKKEFDFKYFPKISFKGDCVMQIASSGPDSNWETIHKAFFSAINLAKKRVYIQTPYFIPDESILMALKTAALCGIDVRIIFPGIPDHKIVYYASMSYFKDVLKAGAKVYLYQKGFIHSKVMIVDDEVASVGTANMDLRSFMINFEINGFIYDKKIIKQLENDFLNDLKDSKILDLKRYEQRNLKEKLGESFSRLFSPIL
ncbi:cardiolipin synthase [Peptostreptococcaceae bacterium AGR-M142]